MADTLGLTNAYKTWQDTQTVTYTAVRSTGNVTDSVGNSLKRAVTRNEVVASGGLFTMQDVAWNLPNANLASAITPQEGDTITDASSVVWTIIDVQKLGKGTRWRFVCRRQR